MPPYRADTGEPHSDQPASPGDILNASAGAMKGTGTSGQWKRDMAGLLCKQLNFKLAHDISAASVSLQRP